MTTIKSERPESDKWRRATTEKDNGGWKERRKPERKGVRKRGIKSGSWMHPRHDIRFGKTRPTNKFGTQTSTLRKLYRDRQKSLLTIVYILNRKRGKAEGGELVVSDFPSHYTFDFGCELFNTCCCFFLSKCAIWSVPEVLFRGCLWNWGNGSKSWYRVISRESVECNWVSFDIWLNFHMKMDACHHKFRVKSN